MPRGDRAKWGGRRQTTRPDAKKAGRPPQSTTLHIGDAVALRYGVNRPLELGEVTEIMRGIPRTTVIQLRNGETIWLLIETPKAALTAYDTVSALSPDERKP